MILLGVLVAVLSMWTHADKEHRIPAEEAIRRPLTDREWRYV